MGEFVKILADLGPVLGSVNVVLLAGLIWLARDGDRILQERDAGLLDARMLREKRADDLRDAAIEYRDHSVATRDTVRDLSANIRAALDARRHP